MWVLEAIPLHDWVGIVGGIIGIAIAGGGVAVFFRASYTSARMEALRQDLTDSDKRVERLQAERAADQGRITTLEARMAASETENKLLRDMVTQRAQVDELGIILNDHHRESLEAWSDIRTAVGELKEAIDERAR